MSPPPPRPPSKSSQRGSSPEIGTVIADRYRIDELLGEGGMGKVFAAEHVLMRKKLALKILHSELTNVPEVVARFEREARAAANIEHPNIAAATDFGKLPDGAVYLALEFVEGRSLRDEIAEGPIPAARALKIARQIASALASAHALEIVHRDLKPENVMLVQKGAERDFVKVLDFGIAKVPIGKTDGTSEAPITKYGIMVGTPEYMAPEQALGKPVDGRADIFSLGVITYEMLTGTRPFSKKHAQGILGQQLKEGAPPLARRAPGVRVPAQVEALTMHLLQVEADKRPQRAAELVSTIDALLVQSLEQSGQLFTQIAGTMLGKGPAPVSGSSPDLSGAALDPRHREESVPDVGRAPLESSSGGLPRFGLDTESAAVWPDIPPGAPVAGSAASGQTSASADGMAGAGPSTSTPVQPAGAEPESQAARAGLSGGALMPILDRPWPKPALDLFAWIDQHRDRLPTQVRKVPAPALAGAAAGVAGVCLLLVVGLMLALATSGSDAGAAAPASASSGSSAGPTVTPAPGPTQAELDKAKASGAVALHALSLAYPQDPRIHLELAKAYRLQKKDPQAVAAVGTALRLDPSVSQKEEVASLLWQTAQQPTSMDATFALLQGPMRSKGADIVFDLAIEKRVRAAVKHRASRYLSSEQFDKQASPALKVAVALRHAKTCAEAHALLPRARDTGDERSLRYLRRYQSTTGCGGGRRRRRSRSRSQDCYPCMRGDTLLKQAISAIEKRSRG